MIALNVDNFLPGMYIPHLIFTVLFQVLTTSSLAIDISPPNSLLQNQGVTPNSTLPVSQIQPHNLTDRYYVECDRVTDPPLPGLNPSSCLDAATKICDQLIIMRNRWHWVDRPGCYLGYFLPGRFPAEELPSQDECRNDIYGLIIERCAFRSQYNVGSINVLQLPKSHAPGLPMTEGYPRYIMAPEQL